MTKRKSPDTETQQNKKLKSFYDKEQYFEGFINTFENGIKETKEIGIMHIQCFT